MEKVSNKPLISIIIPVYRVEDYLSKCLDSVISQTYENIEIILVDDGSDDNCPKICDDYSKKDNRIKVIHKSNGGLSDARNVGIENSNGDFIVFIDSDDYVSNNYVEELFNLISDNKADIGITTHYIVNENNKKPRYQFSSFELNSHDILDRMLYDEDIDVSAWGKIYKRELFQNTRFPFGRFYEDAATFYQLVLNSCIIRVKNIPTYYYVIRSNSISQSVFSETKMDLIKSTVEMTDSIKKVYSDLKKGCDRRLMFAYLSTLSQLATSKVKNEVVEKQLMSYIKENRKNVLSDKRIPKRDRFALIISKFGFGFYRFCWRLYKKNI